MLFQMAALALTWSDLEVKIEVTHISEGCNLETLPDSAMGFFLFVFIFFFLFFFFLFLFFFYFFIFF